MVEATESTANNGKHESKDWVNRCIQPLYDSFPDGGQIVQGALFLRNHGGSEGTTGVAASSPMEISGARPTSPTAPIKYPISRRLSGWLSYFYPQSPPANKSPSASDVETEPIQHRLSPPPAAVLAKQSPPKSILKAPTRRLSPMEFATLPEPIESKLEFLQRERERHLAFSALNFATEEPITANRLRRLVIIEDPTAILETWSKEDYNRQAIDYVARALTPNLAMMIKRELNDIKAEMEVHEASRHHTQFYQVK